MQSSSSGNSNGASNGDPEDFVEVWGKNLEKVFAKIRKIVQKYPYVAMVRRCSLIRDV